MDVITHQIKLLMVKSKHNPYMLFHLSEGRNAYLLNKGQLFKNDSYNLASATKVKFSELPKGQLFKCSDLTGSKVYSF